ncbi:Purine nucleoside permease [Trametes pubescens]|uniref:Purine nucleoside permease n=1 Tax=Trametes pubescens TaxID=154538 RepID=A0A1M2V5R9_TRAPU|nr:Purine nucleoside permease [Trametes pubescens]
MLALASLGLYTLLRLCLIPVASASSVVGPWYGGGHSKIAPKVFILDAVSHGPLRVSRLLLFRCSPLYFQFDAEGDSWYGIPEFDVLARNITVPGFSPLFPDAHCTRVGSICQLTTGEAEINAASTITALVLSPLFDLRQTYFLVAGIAGISPKEGTLGTVTFARFAVQVALQYEFDAREIPADWPTGYVPQGSLVPGTYPQSLYGTEVFELNEDLRQAAIKLAKTGTLADDAQSQAYRAHYANATSFAAGAAGPSVVACDTATSDVFWSGNLLADAFENATHIWTNGSATYCTTQQEDNGILEALLRGARARLVDFARVLIMRTASDFDRPYPGQSAEANLFAFSPGFAISIANLPAAGVPVVKGIVAQWHSRFKAGIRPSNYVGDVWGSLGGAPDYGPGSIFANKGGVVARRSLRRDSAARRGTN